MFFASCGKQEVLPMAKRKNKKIIVKRNRLKGNTETANRKYKDTVFRMLFSDRKNLLSLYNAINETSYTNAAQLEIVTLENAIYMGMKNDLAFIINTNLFLYEHQSTYNPNMPLRDLFYISSEYQKLVDWKSLYTSTRLRIPTPNFIVFYNGTEKKEDRWVDYLSESYENMSGEPNLELKVITLNINVGHNKKLMEECRTLREYAQYVDKVRRYSNEMELNTAVERAVSESIQEGILKEFFCFSVQLGKEYYLDVQKEVMDCVLNLKDADELIEFFLKRDSEYLVSLLIKLNLLIKERGKNMTKGMTVAYACAKKVAEKLPENKRKSYRQRLTSSLVLKDYSAFLDILAQLSNYTDIQFDFVYDLFENFEDNKELAYTFANAMTKKSKVQDKQTGGKENE